MSLRALETSADPVSPPTVLHTAAQIGDLETVQKVLENEPETVNSGDFYGRTALLLAANEGHDDVLRCLLAHGASVDLPDRKLRTALFVAVKGQHGSSMKLLLQSGATPGGDPGNMTAPLSLAAMDGYLNGVKLLASSGGRLTRSPQHRFSHPAMWSAVAYDNYQCFKHLVTEGLRQKLHRKTESCGEYGGLGSRILKSWKLREPMRYLRLSHEMGVLRIEEGMLDQVLWAEVGQSVRNLMGTPRKLLSLCRCAILEANLDTSSLPSELIRYTNFDCVLDPWTPDDPPSPSELT